MRKALLFLFLSAISIVMSAQTSVYLSTGGKSVTATLVDNEATRTLLSLLSSGPITISMEDYGGFEKVGSLPQSLPTSDTQISTEPGDIMLYLGQNIVIFYGTNSWSYTRLGKIDNATAESVKSFLGSGDMTLTISLNPAGLPDISIDKITATETIYDLSGHRVTSRPLVEGMYIVNGKKKFIH